jgi:hypothetical protein
LFGGGLFECGGFVVRHKRDDGLMRED